MHAKNGSSRKKAFHVLLFLGTFRFLVFVILLAIIYHPKGRTGYSFGVVKSLQPGDTTCIFGRKNAAARPHQHHSREKSDVRSRCGFSRRRLNTLFASAGDDSIFFHAERHGGEDSDPASFELTKLEGKHGTHHKFSAAWKASLDTWNWCNGFVAAYQLCPWARASVESSGAIQIYVLSHPLDMEACIQQVAEDFCKGIDNKELDPNTAIAFVVVASTLADGETSSVWEFVDFYDWFLDLEESWLDSADEESEEHVTNTVTLAPFHPEWMFESSDSNGNDGVFEIEKQSPYPSVTIVSSKVIEAAGLAASEQIASKNAEILGQKSLAEWKKIYAAAVSSRP